MSRRHGMTKRIRRGTITCPHCQSDCLINGSHRVTDLVRDLQVHCSNTDCGHTFKAQVSFVYTISPSAMPREGLDLPMAPPEYRRQSSATAQDEDGPHHDPNQFNMFEDPTDDAPQRRTAG